MTSPYAALGQLKACLAGRPMKTTDWIAVVQLANEALLTPQLAASLQTASHLPDDARAYLAEVRGRNAERNRRLAEQLTEAVGVLNRAGIEPTLLEGAAFWARREPSETFDRRLDDLDILVRPGEAERALGALGLHGYAVLPPRPGQEGLALVELARPRDVGALLLHERPPGLAATPDLTGHRRLAPWNGVAAWIPSPAALIAFGALRHRASDDVYWRGGFDLRRLHDIAVLTASREGVDWDHLAKLSREKPSRSALSADLLAAVRLMGAQVPAALADTPGGRFQQGRRIAQFRWPALRRILALFAMGMEIGDAFHHAVEGGKGRRDAQGLSAARLDRLGHIFSRP